MLGIITYRVASPSDFEEILDIYRPYVESTTVTFEVRVPTPEEFRCRVERTLEKYPYLVAEGDGKILGYAYASPYRSREGFHWTPELSVYVRRGYHGNGIGSHLYAALLDLLRLQGYQNVCSVLSYPNPESEKLHNRFAFRLIGVQKKCDFKCGRWCDVAIFQRPLGDHPTPPPTPIPFPQLPKETVDRILKF
ncbi:MAG: N-acetyltransferase [Clostridia bacterium]|nr:N-acetyltransferase [Clostridia bacterium]